MLQNDTNDEHNKSGLRSRLRTATLVLRADNAANRFMLAARRLHQALLELRYRPDQPRAPAGTPEGGQWVDAGGGSVSYLTPSSTAKPAKLPSPAATFPSPTPAKIDGGTVRIADLTPSNTIATTAKLPATTSPDSRVHVAQGTYPRFPLLDASLFDVDLRAEEQRNPRRSHAFSKHVGKTTIDLMTTAFSRQRIIVLPNGSSKKIWHPAEGSFLSEVDANNFVSEALSRNPDLVWLAVHGNNRVRITALFGSQTGVEAYTTGFGEIPIIRPTFSVRVLLGHDPTPGSRGYLVITAFPMNDVPDEIFTGEQQ